MVIWWSLLNLKTALRQKKKRCILLELTFRYFSRKKRSTKAFSVTAGSCSVWSIHTPSSPRRFKWLYPVSSWIVGSLSHWVLQHFSLTFLAFPNEECRSECLSTHWLFFSFSPVYTNFVSGATGSSLKSNTHKLSNFFQSVLQFLFPYITDSMCIFTRKMSPFCLESHSCH